MKSNITQDKGYNSFQWSNLTAGKLMCIHRLAKAAAEKGDALANDLYHDIELHNYNNPDAKLMLKTEAPA